MMMDEPAPCSLLVLVLDTNPVWWGSNTASTEGQISLSQCIDSVMVFANSHLTMNHNNKLAVIAAHTNKSVFLYPTKETTMNADEMKNSSTCTDGRYEVFCQIDEKIMTEIKDLILNNMRETLESDTVLAGAMAMGLCYINRMMKECPVGLKMSARILVIKGSDDNPAQYMNLMNTVFTAQKQNVVIDACVLDNDSGLLQQACDITGGMYLKVPQPKGLLQYLLWVMLPDISTRSMLTLPPRAQVDYRAACFCHRHLIDIGYVCSVCLSIFCTFSPICSTCQTTFKLKGQAKILKRKTKKPNT